MRALQKTTLPLLAVASSLIAIAAIFAGCTGGGGGGTAIVTKLVPAEGSSAGGTFVLVNGSNFGNGPASVLFNGVPATDVEVLSDNQLSCVTPPHDVNGTDVEAVDVKVRASGNKATILLGYQYVKDTELEPQNASGFNDTFPAYKRVPTNADYTGYIGDQGDIDVLHLHTPSDGRVLIDLSWTASYMSNGLAGMSIEFFHGPEPTPNPDSYYGGQTIGVGSGLPGSPDPAIVNFLRMSYVTDGHGPFLVIRGIGSATHAGFDPLHPYTLHAEFVPDPNYETQPAKDNFHVSAILNTSLILNEAAYDQDYDWFRYRSNVPGWGRLVVDASLLGTDPGADELLLGATMFRQDSDLDGNLISEVQGAEISIGDKPRPFAGVFEVLTLDSGHNYFLRLNNANLVGGPTAAYSYPVRWEQGPGNIEDTEPGVLLPAETEAAPNNLGAVPANATGYVWHDADKDFFRVSSGANFTVTWNHTAVRARIGDYDATLNPLGGAFGVMVFDSAWGATIGHVPNAVQTVNQNSFDFTPAVNTHVVNVNANGSPFYYILLNTSRGYSTNPADSYTLTVN